MSDHPEVPRVSFNDDGESMNLERAVERFREMLEVYAGWASRGTQTFALTVEVRPCDCDSTLEGRDEGCPLHGDPSISKKRQSVEEFLISLEGKDDETLVRRHSEWLETGGQIMDLVLIARAAPRFWPTLSRLKEAVLRNK